MATWTSSLTNFKGALQYGGARPSLFEFNITGVPTDVSQFKELKYFCTVSALPPLTVTPIERQYFGRTVKMPGDLVFGDLSTTIIQTEGANERSFIETWMDNINGHLDNRRDYKSEMGDEWGEAELTQYAKNGKKLMTASFVGLWPTTISEIALSYDTVSDIEQYDVTWAYQYYTLKGSGVAATDQQ